MKIRTILADLLADPGSSAPATVSPSSRVAVSYQALAEQIERLSAQFSSAGLKPGDCVAVEVEEEKRGKDLTVAFDIRLSTARQLAIGPGTGF